MNYRYVLAAIVFLAVAAVYALSVFLSTEHRNPNQAAAPSTPDFRQVVMENILAHGSDLRDLRGDIDVAALHALIDYLEQEFPRQFADADQFRGRLAELERALGRVDAFLQAGGVADRVAEGAAGGVTGHVAGYEAGSAAESAPVSGSDDGSPSTLEDVQHILAEAFVFQRDLTLANPVFHAHPVLYVVRPQYNYDHHNTETLYHPDEPNNTLYQPGGPLKWLDTRTGATGTLLDPGPDGHLRDPEVNFEADRVLVSLRRSKREYYSIYELELDTRRPFVPQPVSLRRLTADPEASDTDPVYLPDGGIVFSSTREPKYCQCNMHIMANLFRMEGDGANIHQISNNTLFDNHTSLLPDGRLLYTRWEYVDRNFGDAQGLWTANPDGTNHSVFWGNNTVSPAGVFDARIIPGTDEVVCVFGSCHDRPWGALAILNRSKGIDSEKAVERIWPASARERISIDGSNLPRPFMEDHFVPVRQRFEDPYPLTHPRTGEGGVFFLVSRNVNYLPSDRPIHGTHDLNGIRMGLFLVDVFGNEILVHSEGPGVYDPVPLARRPRPGTIRDRRSFDSDSDTGLFYIMDVYDGGPMGTVPRGQAAWLRVIESTEKRHWTIPGYGAAQFVHIRDDGSVVTSTASTRPAVSWAGFEVKRILGTVPIEPDGSAYVEVPSETFLYFQVLDHDKKMIASMRSGTQVQAGEVQGCVGCHDDRLAAPPPVQAGLAMQRAPDRLDGWMGPARPFNYRTEVQPVWDAHCLSCHDFGAEAADRLILAPDKELIFNASYVQLFRRWGMPEALVHTLGLGLAPVLPAYATGAHQSRLIEVLEEGHHSVALSTEEMERIVTWIDIGGPYFGSYASAHPDHLAGRSPLSVQETRRLVDLTGIAYNPEGVNSFNHWLWVSFERPELSPCLQDMDKASEAYREALAIIEAGRERLLQRPGADMPGFVPAPEHLEREEKYERLRERELQRRRAIRQGERVYDAGLEKVPVRLQ